MNGFEKNLNFYYIEKMDNTEQPAPEQEEVIQSIPPAPVVVLDEPEEYEPEPEQELFYGFTIKQVKYASYGLAAFVVLIILIKLLFSLSGSSVSDEAYYYDEY